MKMEQCSETSAYKIQPLGNYPEESMQQETKQFRVLVGLHIKILQKPSRTWKSDPLNSENVYTKGFKYVTLSDPGLTAAVVFLLAFTCVRTPHI
jgi:hypothetical protein